MLRPVSPAPGMFPSLPPQAGPAPSGPMSACASIAAVQLCMTTCTEWFGSLTCAPSPTHGCRVHCQCPQSAFRETWALKSTLTSSPEAFQRPREQKGLIECALESFIQRREGEPAAHTTKPLNFAYGVMPRNAEEQEQAERRVPFIRRVWPCSQSQGQPTAKQCRVFGNVSPYSPPSSSLCLGKGTCLSVCGGR